MGMLEMSPEYVEEWRQKCHDLAAAQIEGEEVLAAAGFRHAGASANYVASKAQMGALYAFKLVLRGRDHKVGEEVASWDRARTKIAADRGGTMTSLTIESPADESKASLVGIGVRDDPVSLEVIDVLQGIAPIRS